MSCLVCGSDGDSAPHFENAQLQERMVDVLMERDRYRKALQEIVEGDIDAYLIACEALGIHKK